MSLDVYLNRKVYLSYDKGTTYTEQEEQVYWANITHNLGEMARKANIYKALWRPEEINAEKAQEQLFLSGVRLSLDFAEWIDIHGIRDGQHEWKYKGDNYKKKFSTQEMFDEWQKVTTNEA